MMATKSPVYRDFSEKDIELEDSSIGRGSFGSCFRGKLRLNDSHEPSSFQDVVVKCLNDKKDREKNEWVKRKFASEIKILHHVDHPNIVKIMGMYYSTCRTNPGGDITYGYVMELCEHKALSQFMQNLKLPAADSPASYPELLYIHMMFETAEAFRYLHSLNPPVIHTDLCLDNILVTHVGHAKVCDFGLARVKDISNQNSTMGKKDRGRTERIPHERIMDFTKCSDEKTDCYQYGVTLFEVFCELHQNSDSHYRTNMYNHCERKTLQDFVCKKINEKLSENEEVADKFVKMDMVTLVSSCIDPDPDKRFTFDDISQHLSSMEKEEKIMDTVEEQRKTALLHIPKLFHYDRNGDNQNVDDLTHEFARVGIDQHTGDDRDTPHRLPVTPSASGDNTPRGTKTTLLEEESSTEVRRGLGTAPQDVWTLPPNSTPQNIPAFNSGSPMTMKVGNITINIGQVHHMNILTQGDMHVAAQVQPTRVTNINNHESDESRLMHVQFPDDKKVKKSDLRIVADSSRAQIKWKRIVASLGLSLGEIHRIQSMFGAGTSNSDMLREALRIWWQREGPSATLKKLTDVLQEENCLDAISELAKKHEILVPPCPAEP